MIVGERPDKVSVVTGAAVVVHYHGRGDEAAAARLGPGGRLINIGSSSTLYEIPGQ